MQQNSTRNNLVLFSFKTYKILNKCMNFYQYFIQSLHCHINPPSFVVNELDEAGVVKVPGDDGREDLLGDLLNNVETWKEIFCNITKS